MFGDLAIIVYLNSLACHTLCFRQVKGVGLLIRLPSDSIKSTCSWIIFLRLHSYSTSINIFNSSQVESCTLLCYPGLVRKGERSHGISLTWARHISGAFCSLAPNCGASACPFFDREASILYGCNDPYSACQLGGRISLFHKTNLLESYPVLNAAFISLTLLDIWNSVHVQCIILPLFFNYVLCTHKRTRFCGNRCHSRRDPTGVCNSIGSKMWWGHRVGF